MTAAQKSGEYSTAIDKKKTKTHKFIDKARVVHDWKYSYRETNVVTNKIKVKIKCQDHGVFEQTPTGHLKGQGCPACANLTRGYTRSSFKRACIANNNGKGILYFIRCFNATESFYKIGITSKSLEDRFNSNNMPYQYEVIQQLTYLADVTYNLETALFKRLSDHQYKPSITFRGSTECFSSLEALKECLKLLQANSIKS